MKTVIQFFALIMSTVLLTGCWNVIGKEMSYVWEGDSTAPYSRIIIFTFILLVLLRPWFHKDRDEILNIKNYSWEILIWVIAFAIAYGIQFTILGTIGMWIFTSVAGWGIIGIALFIVLGFSEGFIHSFMLLPLGLACTIPMFLVYHDPRVLTYYLLPGIVGLFAGFINNKYFR